MVMKFRTEKKKPIVCCILDIIDNCQSGYAREVCVNLTDFLIHTFLSVKMKMSCYKLPCKVVIVMLLLSLQVQV